MNATYLEGKLRRLSWQTLPLQTASHQRLGYVLCRNAVCAAQLLVGYSLRVRYPWRPSLLPVQGKEVTLLGTIATGGRGKAGQSENSTEPLPGGCSISNKTITLMNGHKALKESPNY